MHLIAYFALTVASLCYVQADDYTYAIFLPKFVRPGVPTKFVAENFRNSPVRFEATLSSKDFFSEAVETVSGGKSETMMFDKVPFDYEGSTDFEVKVKGVDPRTKKVLFTETTNKMKFQKKFISIFIQTDKAIYQPSQMIKFRAVVTDSDLLPYDGTATYKLTDPNNNVIIQEKNARLISGVVGSEFKLGRYSTLGDWKISYQVHGYEETLSVTVEEYKLPKFKVEVKPDKTFMHPGSRALTGEITGTYTFGQPVKGSARLEIVTTRYHSPRSSKPRDKIIKKYPRFDGSESFTIDAEDIEDYLGWNPKNTYFNLQVTAYVKDKNTGDELKSDTVTIQMKNTKLKVEAIAKPANIKPGLPYTAYLKVSEHDGTLLSNEDRRDLDMVVSIEYNYPYTAGGWWLPRPPIKVVLQDLDVSRDGIAILNMVAEPDNFETIYFNVKIKSYPDANRIWVSWSAQRFESPSNTYIQVSTDDTSLSVNDRASLTIQTTWKAEMYWITILARGKLVKKDVVNPSSYEKEKHSDTFYYGFTITSEMSPNVYVIVSFILPDGEIIADSIKINVQAALKNKVTISTSSDKTDAGKPVKITVKAADNSFVGLRAIDQSVLLLKEGNDITQDKIFADLDKYGTTSSSYVGWGRGFGLWWWPYPIRGADVKEVFENSGVIVLTDALVYGKPPKFQRLGSFFQARAIGGIVMDQPGQPGLPGQPGQPRQPAQPRQPYQGQSPQPTRLRAYFPEAWIWTDDFTGSDGSVTFSYTTPDTITTWELSSFAVSDTKGLGVTKQNSKITVFRNFFISLNLPPTMTRGEVLNMRTTLFNYFDDELTVTVTLKENEWYDLVIIGDDAVAAGPKRTVTIPRQDSVTVVFPIKFKKVGLARISVAARSSMAGDAVDRTLVVKPEGIPKTVSHSTIIDRADRYDPDTIVTFDVDIPKDVVPGSAYVKFSVSGNILGSALSNLGSLLRMPSGCGEQTMLSFAPDVYISLYLKGVGELTGEIKQKSKSHIQEGYQNELRYQRSDGSFSAFGKNDRSGSTWLTAFVVKCFVAATKLDSDLVERSKINQAINFIIKQQNRDGTFDEPGKVLHKDMQGGVDSELTTTAYMLIAMAEGGYFDDKDVTEAMDKAVRYLKRNIDSIRDTYTLAIVTYALALADKNSREAKDAFDLLNKWATVSGNLLYWEKEATGISHCEGKKEYCPYAEDSASSASIEITAYALLTFVQMGKTKAVMPIVRWLVEQRGAFGGYHSTQDTVMAIQALSTVAMLFEARDTRLDIEVTHDGDDSFSENFRVNADNAIVLQMADLPTVSGTVTITATGKGFADVQLTVSCNLPVGPRSDEPFDIKIDLKDNKKEKGCVVLVICSKINQNRREVIDGTGMYVVSVTLPSGFTVDDKQATKENKNLKLVELVGDEVTGYFDELPKGRTICMTLKLQRYAEVSGVKPQIIKGIDYYEPARMAMRTYQLVPCHLVPTEEYTEEAEICALCGRDCVGCLGRLKGQEPVRGTVTKSYCDKRDACPCPDFVDGVYLDPSSGIMKLRQENPSDTACSAPNGAGNSKDYVGLPGTLIEKAGQYIDCPSEIFGQALKSKKGFTVSLLVYPLSIKKDKRATVFAIGAGSGHRGELYVLFEKRKGSDIYWVKMRLNGDLHTIRPVRTSDLPPNRWSHVTLTYTAADGPRIYVNGVSKGKRFIGESSARLKQGVTMKIGKSHVSKGDDAFHGLVSHLDVWTRALTEKEIRGCYDDLKSLLTQKNAMLSESEVHHVVPDSIRHCFKGEYNVNELVANPVRSLC